MPQPKWVGMELQGAPHGQPHGARASCRALGLVIAYEELGPARSEELGLSSVFSLTRLKHQRTSDQCAWLSCFALLHDLVGLFVGTPPAASFGTTASRSM